MDSIHSLSQNFLAVYIFRPVKTLLWRAPTKQIDFCGQSRGYEWHTQVVGGAEVPARTLSNGSCGFT
jgi:hypothetical protein